MLLTEKSRLLYFSWNGRALLQNSKNGTLLQTVWYAIISTNWLSSHAMNSTTNELGHMTSTEAKVKSHSENLLPNGINKHERQWAAQKRIKSFSHKDGRWYLYAMYYYYISCDALSYSMKPNTKVKVWEQFTQRYALEWVETDMVSLCVLDNRLPTIEYSAWYY